MYLIVNFKFFFFFNLIRIDRCFSNKLYLSSSKTIKKKENKSEEIFFGSKMQKYSNIENCKFSN